MSIRVVLSQVLAAGVVAFLVMSPASAQEPKPEGAVEEVELTPEEKAERESRKAC